MIFSLLCFVIVVEFYKLKIDIPKVIGRPFELFGIATYGVYLLHPVVHFLLTGIFKKFNILGNIVNRSVVMIISVSFVTVILSLISYYKFESKFMKYASKSFRLSKKKSY
ncbi:hypothetical protein NNC19_00695 [Clostridium sp. SHJSY1]|nr:hypothetical protein [Clostridium sp. SHJSY1]